MGWRMGTHCSGSGFSRTALAHALGSSPTGGLLYWATVLGGAGML